MILSGDFALALVSEGRSISPSAMYRTFLGALVVAAKKDFEKPTYGIRAPGYGITISIISSDDPPHTSQMEWRHVVWAMSGWAQIMTEDNDFRESELRIFWKMQPVGRMSITSTTPQNARDRRAAPRAQSLSLPPNNTWNITTNNTWTGPLGPTSTPGGANDLHFSFRFIEDVPGLRVHHTFMTMIKAMAALAFYPVAETLPGFKFELPNKYDCRITFASAGPDPRKHPILEVGYAIDALVSAANYLIFKERFQPIQGKLTLGNDPVGYTTIDHATPPQPPSRT